MEPQRQGNARTASFPGAPTPAGGASPATAPPPGATTSPTSPSTTPPPSPPATAPANSAAAPIPRPARLSKATSHELAQGLAGRTAHAMEIGQHIIAAVLTLVGAVRAYETGLSLQISLVCALAILAWHTAGTVFPVRPFSRRAAAWWLVGFAFIWLAAVAVSPEFVWVSFLLWLLAGHLLSLPWGIAFSLAVLILTVTAPVLHHGSTTYSNVIGPVIGAVFTFGISRGYLLLLRDAAERERLLASLTRAQQEMSQLQDELALTQRRSGAIAERTRLSRDIHDTVAQSLSSIRLLAHAGAASTGDVAARHTFTQVEALSGQSLADVRRIVAELAPTELEHGALATALQDMLERLHTQAGLQTELNIDDSLPVLPTEVEVALLRTAQSALSNVRLHSGAARVVVSLIDAGDSVRLDIIDDGRGFDLLAWEQGTLATGSYGLRFMRTRLRELGGGIDIETAPGEGTALSVHLPLRTEATPAAIAPGVVSEAREVTSATNQGAHDALPAAQERKENA
ncbi:MAG: sensor histidine kinase [Buchananella hordeovulneris]|nr:sensor histidine kinase [Buchananella hordeovulneris]